MNRFPSLRFLLLALATLGAAAAEPGISVPPADPAAAPAPIPALVPLAAPAPAPAAAPAPAITSEQFAAALAQAISAGLKLDGQLQVDLLRPWTAPAGIAADDWKVELADLPSQPSSTMLVHCRLVSAGAVLADLNLTVHAQLWRDGWVTRAPVERGQEFDPTLFDVRRVDSFHDRDALLSGAEEVDQALTRNLPAGHVLTRYDFAKRPLVIRGHLVEVSAVEGALTVTVQAQALADGTRGDTILVRNLESMRDFTGQVVGENRVEVRF